MTSQAMSSALARLDASRLNLRRELLPAPEPEETNPDGTPFVGRRRLSRRLRAAWRHWSRRLDFWPVAGIATGMVQGWWHMHPWRATTELLADEIHARSAPWIRRHPVTSVAGAAALGAVVVVVRPWRWPLVNQQLRPLPGRLGRWAMHQLAQAPVQAAIAAIVTLMTAQNDNNDPADKQAEGRPDAGSSHAQVPEAAEAAAPA